MAAGAASGRLIEGLGQPLPVTPRKRSVFSFRAPLKAANFPMLFDSSGAWVRPEGEGFIGGIQPPADRDPDASGDYEPHHDLMDEVFWPAIAARIPALEQLRLDRAWAGHYEVNGLDHNGILGPHDQIANLVFATGFSGHGVMHAPAAGRGVAELVLHGRYTSLDMSALGYHRIRAGEPMHESIVY
jgi:glycine/D-amino acid oxidase-like deaminating enzyme